MEPTHGSLLTFLLYILHLLRIQMITNIDKMYKYLQNVPNRVLRMSECCSLDHNTTSDGTMNLAWCCTESCVAYESECCSLDHKTTSDGTMNLGAVQIRARNKSRWNLSGSFNVLRRGVDPGGGGARRPP